MDWTPINVASSSAKTSSKTSMERRRVKWVCQKILRERKAKITCFRCGIIGHRRENCSLLPQGDLCKLVVPPPPPRPRSQPVKVIQGTRQKNSLCLQSGLVVQNRQWVKNSAIPLRLRAYAVPVRLQNSVKLSLPKSCLS